MKNSINYVSVPIEDIKKLENARLELIRILEKNKILNMTIMTSVTNPIWIITHSKYKN